MCTFLHFYINDIINSFSQKKIADMTLPINDIIQAEVHGNNRNAHLFRQALATMGVTFAAFSMGASVGISALIIPKLNEDEQMRVEEKYYSWIASVIPMAMVFGCVVAGALQDIFGRRLVFMFLNIAFVLGWILLGLCRSIETLLLGRILTGFCSGALRPTGMVFLGEITQPKYRGITVFGQSLGTNAGILLNHLLGYGFSWRNNALISCSPLLLSFISLLFLRESPLWLISKGKTNQGIENFHWYRGGSEISQRELKGLLEKQSKGPPMPNAREMIILIFTKNFWIPFSAVILLFLDSHYSGVNTLPFYALDILKRTFDDGVDSFLMMVIIDSVKIISVIIMFSSGKVVPRRKSFYCSSFGTTLLLTILTILLQFKSDKLMWVSVTLLIAYMGLAAILTGVSWSFVAELFPTNLRGIGSGAGSAMSSIILFTNVQLSPLIMDTLGIRAMYGVFAGITFLCSVTLCFLLPETNGKTLQEIEDHYINDKNENTKTLDSQL